MATPFGSEDACGAHGGSEREISAPLFLPHGDDFVARKRKIRMRGSNFGRQARRLDLPWRRRTKQEGKGGQNKAIWLVREMCAGY